jgi:hypothetical protein
MPDSKAARGDFAIAAITSLVNTHLDSPSELTFLSWPRNAPFTVHRRYWRQGTGNPESLDSQSVMGQKEAA